MRTSSKPPVPALRKPSRSPGRGPSTAESKLRAAIRRAEKGLRASEEKYRNIVETANEGVWIVDAVRKTTFVNAEMAAMLGYTPDEMLGRSALEFLDAYGKTLSDRYLARRRKGRSDKYEMKFLRKDGSTLWALVSARPVLDARGKYAGSLSMLADITGRKRGEEERVLKMEFLRMINESRTSVDLHDGAQTFFREHSGCETVMIALNGREEESAFQGMAGKEYGAAANLSEAVFPLRANDEILGSIKFIGGKRDLFTRSSLAFWQRIAGQFAIAVAKLRAEEAVRWSEKRNLLLSRSAERLLSAEEPQRIIDDICREAMEFLDCRFFFNFLAMPDSRRLRLNACAGIPPDEAARIKWLEGDSTICGRVALTGTRIVAEDILNSADPRAALVRGYGVRAYCCHPLKTGGNILGTISFGTTSRDKFEAREISVMQDVAAQVAVAIARKKAETILRRDERTLKELVAEQARSLLKAQEELEQSRRLSDIGTLAATVAHELRNPLAAIRMAAVNIKRKTAGNNIDRHLVNIDRKITESDQIIANLLFYSRLRPPQPQPVILEELLLECAETARARRARVNVETDVASLKGISVQADPVQLCEVINNLLNNACDAVPPEGGKVEMSAKDGDDFVSLSVADNGHGIPPEFLSRVFDPFFTTKAKGTGLGLAVCRQIVQMHHGEIDVRSGEGRGTHVTVRIPKRL